MAKQSEFAFATVKTVKPLTIQIDGDSTVLPAVAYGVTVKAKQRVEVRVRKPPQPPLITRILTAPATGFVIDDVNQRVVISATKDVTDSDDAISSWSVIDSTDGFGVDGGALTVDADLYPNRTMFDIRARAANNTSTDKQTWVIVSGIVGNAYLTISSFRSPTFGSDAPTWAATCLTPVTNGSIQLDLRAQVTNTDATVSGSLYIEISAFPLLTTNGT